MWQGSAAFVAEQHDWIPIELWVSNTRWKKRQFDDKIGKALKSWD